MAYNIAVAEGGRGAAGGALISRACFSPPPSPLLPTPASVPRQYFDCRPPPPPPAASTLPHTVSPLFQHKHVHRHPERQPPPEGRRGRLGQLHAIQTRLAPGPAPLSQSHRPSSSSSPSFSSPAQSTITNKPLVDVRQLSPEDATLRFPSADFAVPTTLPSALLAFFTHPSIILILVGIASLFTGRFLSSPLLPPSFPPLLLELTLIPLTVAGWMLQEWFLHRYLLHSSFPWPGREIHAQHHALPFYHVSIDPPLLVASWGAVACGMGWLVLPQPWVWTVLGTYWLMGLLYEWAHFSVHTRVRPRTALGKAVKAHHTKHHLKCDRLWFAFSWPWIDTLMGTVPGREGRREGGRKGGRAGGRPSSRDRK